MINPQCFLCNTKIKDGAFILQTCIPSLTQGITRYYCGKEHLYKDAADFYVQNGKKDFWVSETSNKGTRFNTVLYSLTK